MYDILLLMKKEVMKFQRTDKKDLFHKLIYPGIQKTHRCPFVYSKGRQKHHPAVFLKRTQHFQQTVTKTERIDC